MTRLLSHFKYGPCPSGRWRYKLQANARFHLGRDVGHHEFCDGEGRTRLVLSGKIAMVCSGYAWNGCDPKWRIGRIWIGTPDFRKTRAASCLHDALCQFAHLACYPLSGRETDAVFSELCRRENFALAWLYGGILDFLGEEWRAFFRSNKNQGRCVSDLPCLVIDE